MKGLEMLAKLLRLGKQKDIEATLDEGLRKELRAHSRFSISLENLVWLSTPNSPYLKVCDLSYGGIALSKQLSDESAKNLREVTLHAMKKSIPARVSYVHSFGGTHGYSFVHDTADVLVFLRDVMEYMKQGSSMRPLDQSILKESLHNTHTTCFRGDGPTDLIIESNDDGDPTKAILTFRDGNVYHEVRFADGKVSSATSENVRSAGTELMSSTHTDADRNLDPQVIEKALYILSTMEPLLFTESGAQLLAQNLSHAIGAGLKVVVG